MFFRHKKFGGTLTPWLRACIELLALQMSLFRRSIAPLYAYIHVTRRWPVK